MNIKQNLILPLLMALAWGTYAQTVKPQLTLVQNPYKELQGGYKDMQPIVYKGKLYMGYNYRGYGTVLVTFDGKKWTNPIRKNKKGKIIGERREYVGTFGTKGVTYSKQYHYSGEPVIYKDRLFVAFFDHAAYRNKRINIEKIRFIDGKKALKNTKSITVYNDVEHPIVTKNRLYVFNRQFDGSTKLTELAPTKGGGEFIREIQYLPSAANYKTAIHYKDMLYFSGERKIYEFSTNINSAKGYRFLYTKLKGVDPDAKPVIWKGGPCFFVKRPLKTPCSNQGNSLGVNLIQYKGKGRTSKIEALAKGHVNIKKPNEAKVIDKKLYTIQQNCKTGKLSLVVDNGKSQMANAYGAECDGKFIKYKSSIFAKYHATNNGSSDAFLTQCILGGKNKLRFKKIKDDYVYINGKVQKFSISYVGFPIIFKNKLYLRYKDNNKKNTYYLMKYTP